MRQRETAVALNMIFSTSRGISAIWLAAGLASIVVGLVLLGGTAWAAGSLLWGVGLVLVVRACWQPAVPRSAEQRSCSGERLVLLAACGLFLMGAVLRLVALDRFPSGMHVDEAATGRISLQILRGEGPHPFGFAFIGDPAPFMYVQALFMAIFGPTVEATRILAGISGALTLPVLWLLARPLFGATVGLLAVALLAVNAADLHFSRMALNVIEVPLFGVLALALCWRGVLARRPVWHLLAGMALGFGQFAAYSGRGFVLGVAGTYGVLLLAHRSRWREMIGSGVLALVGMLLVLAPQFVFVRDNPRQLWDRVAFRSVFRRWDQATEIHGTSDPIWVMIGQVKQNLLVFVNLSDKGTFYSFAGVPLLVPVMAALAIFGLALALWRLRDARYASLLVTCTGVLLGASLSAGVPQAHRVLPMLPIVCVFAAVAAETVALGLVRLISRAGWDWVATPVRVGLFLVVIASVAVLDLREYFVMQPQRRPWQPYTAWAHWLASQPSGQTILLAGAPDVYAWDERMRLYGDGKVVVDLSNPTIDIPGQIAPTQPFTIAVNPDNDDWLPLLRQLVPNATEGLELTPNGDPLILTMAGTADSETVSPGRGLAGTVSSDARRGFPDRNRVDAALVFMEASRLGDGGPFTARWAGQLLVPVAGQYRLELYTDGRGSLSVDGTTVVSAPADAKLRSLSANVRLSPGPHEIQIEYGYLRGSGILLLRWQPPNGRRTIIPPEALVHQ